MQDYLSDLYKKLSGKMKLGRERSEALMEYLQHPEQAFPSIHVAGTNGKGSVTALASVLLEATGLKVGRFTSPHLVHFNERICINGSPINEAQIKMYLEEWDSFMEQLKASFFEITTALGFAFFRDQQVDVAVIETGLGGRLDATNVLFPEVSVITDISFDHTSILGETRIQIAEEKAGIIKPGIPVVTYAQDPEVLSVFQSHTNDLTVLDPDVCFSDVRLSPGGMRFVMDPYLEAFTISLPGRHQLGNIAAAVKAIELFLKRPLTYSELQSGFSDLSWQGRFEYISRNPDIIYDVAHNPEGIRAFCETVQEVYPDKTYYFVLGMLKDKQPEKVMDIIGSVAERIWLCPVRSHRGMDPGQLRELATVFPQISVADTLKNACTAAYGSLPDNTVLCILGSHYIAAEVYSWSKKKNKI